MRDTISARSVKEALGQVRTWRAEVEETYGQGHSSLGAQATALGCLARSPASLPATLCGPSLLRCPDPWSTWGRGVKDEQRPEQTPILSHQEQQRAKVGQKEGCQGRGQEIAPKGPHPCPRLLVPGGVPEARAAKGLCQSTAGRREPCTSEVHGGRKGKRGASSGTHITCLHLACPLSVL